MLKLKIKKSQFDSLDEATQALYKPSGANFVLDVEEDPRIATMNEEISGFQTQVADLTSKVAASEGFIDPKDVPDVSKLQGELDAERTGRAEDASRYQGMIANSMIEAKAGEIASKISKSPKIMSRFIRDSIGVDFEGENPTLRVRGSDGQFDDRSFEDLEKDFLENSDYSDIIIASSAGGGAGGTKSTTPAPTQRSEPKQLSKMHPRELASYITSQRDSQN